MRYLPVLLTLALSACSLTPPLVKPEAPVPAVFPMAPTEPGAVKAANIGWRTMFPDARLQRLIAMALENNRDLRLAALNVEAALIAEWFAPVLRANGPTDCCTQKVNRFLISCTILVFEGFP